MHNNPFQRERELLDEAVRRREVSDEDEYIVTILRDLQPQYPGLTVEEMKRIFDETYERMCEKLDIH